MATVALQVLHNSKESTPFLPASASASLHPPALAWSSSPLAGGGSDTTTRTSSNTLLPSSGSKSDSSSSGNSSSTEDIPTPKDILSNAAPAIANINRKRRVVWDLRHRSSCLSSPKHRYHPYQAKAAAVTAAVTTTTEAIASSASDDVVPSSSSSPSRRTAPTTRNHRRTGSRSSSFSSSSFKPPRSILKCLRNAKVAQYNLTHSSPGRRTIHAHHHQHSPGGRPFFTASPSASPRRRSLSYFASSSSRSPGRSPSGGRSPRVPSLSFGGIVGSKSPSLAEITRANGGGRKHTIAFPDLRAPPPPSTNNLQGVDELGNANTNGTMMMSMDAAPPQQAADAASGSDAANGEASLSGNATTAAGVNGTAPSLSSVGLGLGQPFESSKTATGEASSNDADPRMHIISACHTLKHSLASPIWQDPASRDSAGLQQQPPVLDEEDCFDSQPFDFPPRNIEQILPDHTSSSTTSPTTRSAPFPSVHLRELEAAYATIFQYAQIYVQAWYNVATPDSASTSTSRSSFSNTPSTASSEDNLDREFAKLAPLVLKCVSRDVFRALHPVPVPSANISANVDASSAVHEKASPTIEETREARQALLHRSGLSAADMEEQEVASSSSPLAFPSNSPEMFASKIVAAAAVVPEKPKRVGRSTAEMRRRRNEINVVEAALQAFGTLVSCERFWRYFGGEALQSTICQAAQIPNAALFKGAKHRDLLSSFNWIIANQTLSTPAYLTMVDTPHPLRSILGTVLGAIMSSIDASTKNGEKARRVVSEAFRAIRTLVLAYPSDIIMRLVGEEYIGKVAFVARYLCSPTKALRDNAALLLSAIAFAITANWDDQSTTGRTQKAKAQEMVSMELYRYWSLSPDQVEIDELSRHLNIALETKLPSDYHFVRLVVNTLPIILGRRFRKMERKGPHMWLAKAIDLKKREELQNAGPSYSAAFHLMTFLHVTYAWTSSSKEVAGKHMVLLEEVRRTGGETPRQSDGQKMEEGFWGLGDKALRVIAQNVDAVTGRPWTAAAYSQQNTAFEIQATVALILSFTYAFVGLSYTAYQATNLANEAERQQNPSLHRDLSKLYDIFISKYMPHPLKAKIASIRSIGWKGMHALLRAGEEHPTEDAALRNWSIDRVINWRMLGTHASQAGQALWPVDLILSETVKAQEIPSLDAAWVYDNRVAVASLLLDAYKALIQDSADKSRTPQGALDSEDWVKNEDGHAIMPTSVSNCIRTFFNTLRATVGQEDSLVEPAESTLDLVLEMAHFIFSIVDEFGLQKEANTTTSKDDLSLVGSSYSTLLHLVNLLEHVFGSICMQSTLNGRRVASVVDDIAQYTLALSGPPSTDLQACSAYLSLVDYIFASIKPSNKAMEAIFSKLPDLLQVDATENAAAILSSGLWCKCVLWTACGIKDDSKTADTISPFICRLLALAPSMFPDSKPEEPVRTAYATLLAITSSSPTEAWRSLQRIARQTGKGAIAEDIFLAWATLPLMRNLSLVEDDTFLIHLAKTGAIAESAPQSPVWSLVDLALALAAGLSKSTGVAAIRILSSLSTTLASLFSSTSLSLDIKSRLYQAMSEAFEDAYKQDPAQMNLDTYARTLMADPKERPEDFVSVWNATYGSTTETLAYSDALKEYIQAALEQGHVLQLPGWPAEIPASEESAAIEVQIEAPSVDKENASIVEESHDSAVVPETQSLEPPRALSELTVEAPAPTIRAKAIDEPIEEPIEETQGNAPQVDSQDLSAIEETQHQSQELAMPAVTTQMPRVSQIPDISDIMDDAPVIGSESRSSLPDETTIERIATDDNLEESNTSVIPETQRVPTACATSLTTEESVTETIPETQATSDDTSEVNVDVREREREGSSDSELSELSEIEETQIIEEVTVTEASSSHIEETPVEQAKASFPILEDAPAQVTKADEPAAILPTAEQSVLETIKSRLSVAHLQSSSNPQILPSPASSVSSSSSKAQAPVRKRQIVEVVIPYRPWIPRYPSVSRSGDENSQNSMRSTVNKVVQPHATEAVKSLAMKTKVGVRKHNRESTDDEDDAETLSIQKKPKSVHKRAISGKSENHHKQSRPQPLQKVDTSASRRLKGTTGLPTIIHAKPAMDTTTSVDSDDDSIRSSEAEIHVASSPHVRRASQISDSVELARKQKRARSGSKLNEEGPTSSSPTTAVSQRVRTYSQSRGSSVTSSKQAGRAISSSRGRHGASVSSRGTSATSRTGKDLARILKDGGDSDIEEVLEDLSAAQMQKLHQQIEERLKRVHGVKPVKRKRSSQSS